MPIIIGAAIGATTGGVIAHNNDQEWWKGAIVGGIIGAAAGGIIGSGIGGVSGLGTKAAGITQTALNNAVFEIALSETFGGGEAWKAGISGLSTGGFGAIGSLMVAKRGLGARLAFQGLSTSLRSLGRNWTQGKDLFSKITVGLGPVNLTFGENQHLFQFWENVGNIITNGIGLANLMTGGKAYFDKENLTFGYYGGFLGTASIYKGEIVGTSFTGGYAVLGNARAVGDDLVHEGRHIWQSRAFQDSFLTLWVLSGISSKLSGRSFRWKDSFNFFERAAYDRY